VRIGEDTRVFHAERGELVQVEEASVVDLVSCHAPRGESVVLVEEKRVELVGALVDRNDGRVHRGDDVGRRSEKRPQAPLHHVGLTRARRTLLRRHRRRGGEVPDRGDDALQLLGVRVTARDREVRQCRFEDRAVAPRRRRIARREVANDERPLFARDGDPLRFELLAELPAEDGQKDLLLQRARLRGPVDVEVVGVDRARAVLEHVVPPDVLAAADPHVIRYEVEHVAHPALRELTGPSVELLACP